MASQWSRPQITVDSDGYLEVTPHDQTTQLISVPLQVLSNEGTLLAVATAVDDRVITLTAGHGVTVGAVVALRQGTRYYFGTANAVNGNDITMDVPIDFAYPTTAWVTVGTANLRLNGTPAAPIVAGVGPPSNIDWEITRVHIRMVDAQVMDAGTFGGRDALPNGLLLRIDNGERYNIGNVKTNGDLAAFATRYEFDEKPPAGKYGFTSNHAIAGMQNAGIALKIRGAAGDQVQVLIQDDLTGLDVITILAIGHVAY